MVTYDFTGPTAGFVLSATLLSGSTTTRSFVGFPVGGANFANIHFTLTNIGVAETSIGGNAAQAGGFFNIALTNNTTSQTLSAVLSFTFASSVTATPSVVFGDSSGLNGAPVVSVVGNAIKITATSNAGVASFSIDSITANFLCFAADTAIATLAGATPVQNLQPGDRVRTADGSTASVKWLGRQRVDVRLMHPARVNPVCITAGALGHGLPERDLRLSPDHAIEIDGLLINAGALVNGSTIYQAAKMPMRGFDYFHVELEEGHQLLLAEGVASESFIDYASRDAFDNAHTADTTQIAEMPLPRISAARLVPNNIRDRLAPVATAAE